MRAAEEDLQLERIQFFEKFGKVALEVLLDFGLRGLRLGFAQLDHDLKVLKLLLRFEEGFGLASEGVGLFDESLGLVAAVPEIISRHQGVNFAEAFLGGG